MKQPVLTTISLLVLVASCHRINTYEQEDQKAKRFIPEVLGALECFALTMEPDGKTLYVTAALRDGGGFYTSEFKDNQWTALEPLSFSSGEFNDNDLFPDPDGTGKYFFMTRRDDNSKPQNLWMVEKHEEAWSGLTSLGQVNSEARDGFPSVSRKGDLYFFSERAGGMGSADIFVSKYIDGEYARPENLGAPINTGGWDGLPYISPNGKVLVFFSDRPGGHGNGDLYVSYLEEDGWSVPENLGSNVNTESTEVTPYIGPEGKYLYFARVEESDSLHRRNIYFIDIKNTLIKSSYLE